MIPLIRFKNFLKNYCVVFLGETQEMMERRFAEEI
jgi:hypothetical protein